MSDRKGSIVLLFIIALAALGFSGYLVVDKFFLTPEPEELTGDGLILVGLWNDLEENLDYAPWDSGTNWLAEFPDNLYNDSNHISVSSNYTRFQLLQKGFYKITVLLLFYGLDSLSDTIYWAVLLRNSTIEGYFERIAIPANPITAYYIVQASFYVESTGLDNFAINCYSNGDSFSLSSSGTNQLAIEYAQ